MTTKTSFDYLTYCDEESLQDELEFANQELTKANQAVRLASAYGGNATALRVGKERRLEASKLREAVLSEIDKRQ